MAASTNYTERRHQLEKLMDERRREIRIQWKDLAVRAGMSVQNLLRIRREEQPISPAAADGIEDALGWSRGSIHAFLDHGQAPTLRQVDHDEPEASEDAIVFVGLREKMRQRRLPMTPRLFKRLLRAIDEEYRETAGQRARGVITLNDDLGEDSGD